MWSGFLIRADSVLRFWFWFWLELFSLSKRKWSLWISSLWPQQWHHHACYLQLSSSQEKSPCLHLSPRCWAVLTFPPPPVPLLIDPPLRCIEYQCSLQHSADLWPPPEAAEFPPNSGRACRAEPTVCQVAYYSSNPPLPGSAQRNSQQERLMERCPGTRARRGGDGKHMWRSGEELQHVTAQTKCHDCSLMKTESLQQSHSVLCPICSGVLCPQQRGKKITSPDLTLKYKHVSAADEQEGCALINWQKTVKHWRFVWDTQYHHSHH